MKNVSEYAVKSPIPVIILFFLLTLGGIIAFDRISIQDFPDIDLPTITVSVSLPGATSSQIETQITRKIEDRVATLGLVKHISSDIQNSNSTTLIQFELNKDSKVALDDVKSAVDDIKGDFPSGATEPAVSKLNVGKTNIGLTPILTYQIKADNLDQFDLTWFTDNVINKLLLSVPKVDKITRYGGVEREIQVLVDPFKLRALDVSVNQVAGQLHDIRQDLSGGKLTVAGLEYTIRQQQDINNANDIANLDIPLGGGKYTRLGSIAKVKDASAEIRQMAFLNGQKVISIQVYPTKDANELEAVKEVRDKVKEFSLKHPHISMTEISNTVQSIKENYDASMHTLYEGAILAIIIVWLFLRDWRATLISATALPLSIIPTWLAIYWLGFTLNTISLLSITLVIGVLIDDAIVEIENISRHLKNRNLSPKEAVIEATREIGTAVIATSCTLVVIFLPTAFMGGVSGRVFKQFGWIAAIAVLFSLLVARLATPIFAAFGIRRRTHKQSPNTQYLMKYYLKVVKWCLANPLKIILTTIAFFLVSLKLISFIHSTFIPASDDDQLIVNVEVTPGSKIETMEGVLQQAYLKTRDLSGIKNVYATIGDGVENNKSISPNSSVTKAKLEFNLTDRDKRTQSKLAIQKELLPRLKTIPGAQFFVAGGHSTNYLLILGSDNVALLEKTAGELKKGIDQLTTLGPVNSDYTRIQPEIIIEPDFKRAAELGVTPLSIQQAIQIATSGDYQRKLPKVNLVDREIPLRVMLDKNEMHSLDDLKSLRVNGAMGKTVPLGSVAKVSLGSSPVTITRYDRMRSVKFEMDLQGHSISEFDKELQSLPTMKHLPSGVYNLPAGENEHIQEMMNSFLWAITTGIICVYLLLVLLFNDFKFPIVILVALPLAAGGALGSLVAFGYSFSLASLIGILMLMGIVTKNSILMVDYMLMAIRNGIGKQEAILDTCVKRARPILMTSIAMIVGMLPIVFSLSSDAAFKIPMAIVLIGGLITSTILCLVIVPVIFDLIDKIKVRGVSAECPKNAD